MKKTEIGRVVIFNGPQEKMTTARFPVRALKNGEILVKNMYTTICGSDLHTFCGHRNESYPSVLGHEIVGEIVDIEPHHSGMDYRGEKLSKGDIITWTIFSSDPDSKHSAEGIPQKGNGIFKYGHALMTPGDPFNGGLSDYCILRSNTTILKLKEKIPFPIISLINCSVATAAGAVKLLPDIKDKRILIFGAGLLGLCTAAICKEAGAFVTIADISKKRLLKAKGFGADKTFVLDKNKDVDEMADDLRIYIGVIDAFFDMSGAPIAMECGLELLDIGGYAIWVGGVFRNRKIQIDAEKVIRNILTIKGLHNYNHQAFLYAVDFIEKCWQKYPFQEVVSKEFTLEETEDAFLYAIEKRPLRVGIRI